MGYYFVNSNIANKRAHIFQILNTARFMKGTTLIFPKFERKEKLKALFQYYGVEDVPVSFQDVFGLKDVSRLSFFLFDILACLFLFKQKRKEKIDYIYFRFGFFFLLGLFARFLKVSFFYEIHRKPRNWTEKIRDKVLAKRASGLVVISERLKKHYLRYNQNILISHDAVSVERFCCKYSKNEARQKLMIGSKKIVGVYLGSISTLKGVDIISDVAFEMPEIDFYLVGPLNKEFE